MQNIDIFDQGFDPGIQLYAEGFDPTKHSISTGDDAVLDDIFSYQIYNKIKNHWRGSSAPANIQPGMIFSDSDDDKLYHRGTSASEEILQATRSQDIHPRFASVRIMDTGADHYLQVACNENLTAHKYLNFITGDATRTITLSGSPTLDDWFDQSVKQAASPTFAACSLGTGELTAGSINRASGTLSLEIGGTGVLLIYTSIIEAKQNFRVQGDLGLEDTGADHYLILKSNENLTGNKYLNFITGDATRTITLSGNPTLNDWFDQSVKQAASPQFADLFINETANADMTTGITINQGAAVDDILTFKGSDIAHGITDFAETDTFGSFTKAVTADGGIRMRGWCESSIAVVLEANYTTDNTAKTENALAPVMIYTYKKSGAGRTDPGADANLFAVCMDGLARFIVDEDGDILYDGTAGAFDKYDDALICHDLSMTLSQQFNKVIQYNQRGLEKLGVLKPFVSTKALNMLLLGAISQLWQKNQTLEDKLKLLEV